MISFFWIRLPNLKVQKPKDFKALLESYLYAQMAQRLRR